MPWTWTWENFRRWWGTGRPCMLHSMGPQRVGHDWVTEQQQHMCVCVCIHTHTHTHTTSSLLGHGYSACFHILAIVNNAAIHIGVHVFFKLISSFAFSGYIQRSGIARSYGSSIYSFFEEWCILFSLMAAPVYIPTNSVPKRFPFLRILSSTCYL